MGEAPPRGRVDATRAPARRGDAGLENARESDVWQVERARPSRLQVATRASGGSTDSPRRGGWTPERRAGDPVAGRRHGRAEPNGGGRRVASRVATRSATDETSRRWPRPDERRAHGVEAAGRCGRPKLPPATRCTPRTLAQALSTRTRFRNAPRTSTGRRWRVLGNFARFDQEPSRFARARRVRRNSSSSGGSIVAVS
jgi:hypothetical protein